VAIKNLRRNELAKTKKEHLKVKKPYTDASLKRPFLFKVIKFLQVYPDDKKKS